MHKRSKLLFAAITAILVLAVAVGSASATRFGLSNRTYRATWSSLVLNPGEVRCPVTLEGSFHSSTITKVIGALIGYTTRAIVNSPACTGGGATILIETLPWHNTYGGFIGPLPTISGILLNLINASFQVRLNLFGVTCLARSTAASPATGTVLIGAGGVVTGLRANPESRIPLTGGCAFLGNATFEGTARTTVLNSTTALTVTLI